MAMSATFRVPIRHAQDTSAVGGAGDQAEADLSRGPDQTFSPALPSYQLIVALSALGQTNDQATLVIDQTTRGCAFVGTADGARKLLSGDRSNQQVIRRRRYRRTPAARPVPRSSNGAGSGTGAIVVDVALVNVT